MGYVGDYEEAEALLRQCVTIQAEAVGEENRETLWSLSYVGEMLRLQDNLDEAETVLREALRKQAANLGEDHRHTLLSMKRLAKVLAARAAPDNIEGRRSGGVPGAAAGGEPVTRRLFPGCSACSPNAAPVPWQ